LIIGIPDIWLTHTWSKPCGIDTGFPGLHLNDSISEDDPDIDIRQEWIAESGEMAMADKSSPFL
jgi:hypothetical protein